MERELIEQIRKEAQKYFQDASGCHAWDHTERVLALSTRIGKKENADLEIIELAAILHDICKPEEMKLKGQICHAEKGAMIAKKILEEHSILKETISAVVHCIETHRTKTNKKPQTIEAKVLFDADKLDSLGAHGIGRLFMFANSYGGMLHDKNVDVNNTQTYTKDDTAYREYLVNVSKLHEKMLTSEGKKIAKQRSEFMKEFFERMNKEADGEA
jgi:uncharacterized protein